MKFDGEFRDGKILGLGKLYMNDCIEILINALIQELMTPSYLLYQGEQ